MRDEEGEAATLERYANVEQLADHLAAVARHLAAQRYYFHLTDGDEVIQDEDGIELSDLQTAEIYALAAVEELRAEDPSFSGGWQGWRLEITDDRGGIVQTVWLNAEDQPRRSLH